MSIISKLKVYKTTLNKWNRLRRVKSKLKSEIENSLIFRQADLKKSFSNRILQSDIKFIHRIIIAYQNACVDQQSKPSVFQVSNEWIPIYMERMGEIIKLLAQGDSLSVKSIYENFMREDCSYGLHGLPFDMHSNYFANKIDKLHREIYLYDFVFRLEKWSFELGDKYTYSDLYMPDFGNPYGLVKDDIFIRTGAEYFHFYAVKIKSLLDFNGERRVVMELGGGYGGMAYFINANVDNVCYINFDLPENCALSAFYLMNAFPEKRVMLYTEGPITMQTINEFDIIIMPNFEITKLPDNSIDLAFNSYSLAEMSEDTIRAYINEMMRASRKYIFHVNHTKITSSIGADDFGISDDKYKLLHKQLAGWNNGRFVGNDEYEFLYIKLKP